MVRFNKTVCLYWCVVSWEDIKLNHGETVKMEAVAVAVAATEVVTTMMMTEMMMMLTAMLTVVDHCGCPSWEDEKLIRLWDPHFFVVTLILLSYVFIPNSCTDGEKLLYICGRFRPTPGRPAGPSV